jgi:site-specific DNA recombinase
VPARNPHVRSVDAQTFESTEALLRGLLFGPSGDPIDPTYASKNKRKYCHYVSKAEMRFGAAGKTHARIPAAEVEAATVNQVKTVLSSPKAIIDGFK